MALTIPSRKKLRVRKPEMWLQKSLEVAHYVGEAPHWAVVPMKKNVKKKKKKKKKMF